MKMSTVTPKPDLVGGKWLTAQTEPRQTRVRLRPPTTSAAQQMFLIDTE
jgi:hypothetical protein